MEHNGIIHGMANEVYHSTPAVSNTVLSSVARSPAHCFALHVAEDRRKQATTPAFFAGTLAHCAILEPAALLDRYMLKPEGLDMRTKEGKAWKAALPSGVLTIDADEYSTALAQRDAVQGVPELAELLADGVAEVSAFWRDDETGLQCKCRPDWVHTLSDGRVILVDVKTTVDCSPQQFSRSVWKYGYHRQAAWYSAGYARAAGVEVAGFVFASVTSAHPFIAAAHTLDDDYMRIGQDECRRLLDEYADCKLTGRWPAFPGMNLLSPPAWAAQSDEVEVFHV
jgi:exodeoxyribonuclease VIII